MNKKIIAIAIASALTAPAAMADIKISGSFYGEVVNRSDDANVANTNSEAFSDGTVTPAAPGEATTAFEDGGKNALNFTATSGNVYGKMGLDVGPGAGQTAGGAGTLKYRDFFIGYKFGDASVQFGTMSGAVKNLEKDPYIATFLQSRGTYAEARTSGAYGSSSYISNVVQYKGKVGAGTLIAQYDPTADVNSSTNEGHMGVSYAAKAGGVGYFVGYNNGTGADVDGVDQTNMKLGASMKFGTIKAGLTYTAADNDGTKWSSIALTADMALGNGLSANVGYGQSTGDANEGVSYRVAVNKSLAKNANLYAGIGSSTPDGGDAATVVGLGMGIKF